MNDNHQLHQHARELALFPERNPNPVLSVSRSRTVIYFNPATAAKLKQLGLDPSRPELLLPPDLSVRLMALEASGDQKVRWEYQIAKRVLVCAMSLLPESGVAHIYISDITERKRAEEALLQRTYYDAVTGLPNRWLMLDRLEQALRRAGRLANHVAVLSFAINRFGAITEGLGYTLVDQLLKAVAERLKKVERCEGVCDVSAIARFEGGEFVLFLETNGVQEGVTATEDLILAMETPFHIGEQEVSIMPSVGLSFYPDDADDAGALIRYAHQARTQAMTHAHRLRCYSSEMDAAAREHLALERDLRRGLERHEFTVYYQPKININNHTVAGVEALVRWQRNGRIIPPDRFVPLAEETGLIAPLGEWVLHSACAQTRTWRATGFPSLRIAVNVSSRQFDREDLPQAIEGILQDTGLAPDGLELEVTETAVMENVARTEATLRVLKAIGIHVSVDDFGTGYSSLSYLKRFQLDALKIDQSFIRDIPGDENAEAIVSAVVALGQRLGLTVVAEGVERPEQEAFLRRQRCDQAQGYLYSRPVTAETLTQWLRQ